MLFFIETPSSKREKQTYNVLLGYACAFGYDTDRVTGQREEREESGVRRGAAFCNGIVVARGEEVQAQGVTNTTSIITAAIKIIRALIIIQRR